MLTAMTPIPTQFSRLESGANDYVTSRFRLPCCCTNARPTRQHEASEDAVLPSDLHVPPSAEGSAQSKGQKVRLTERRRRSCVIFTVPANPAGFPRNVVTGSLGLQFRRHKRIRLKLTSTVCARRWKKDAATPAILVTEAGGYKLVP